MKPKVLYISIIVLLTAVYIAYYQYNKQKKVNEQQRLLEDDMRRFVLAEGEVTPADIIILSPYWNWNPGTRTITPNVQRGGNDKNSEQAYRAIILFEQNLMKNNAAKMIKYIEFLRKNKGYNGIKYHAATLQNWLNENT